MAENGNDHPSDGDADNPKTVPFSDSLKIVVEKIKNEPFLFVIGVAIILVGLAVLATGLGDSNLRLIVIVIAMLAVIAMVVYYLQGVKPSHTIPLVDEPQEPELPPPETLPTTPLVFEKSKEFERQTQFKDKKDLVHRMENDIRDGELILSDNKLKECARSDWDLDRIVFYLYGQYRPKKGFSRDSFNDLVYYVKMEFEKVKASDGERSLMPLHYSVRTTLRTLEEKKFALVLMGNAKDKRDEFGEIYEYIKARPELDKGNEVKDNLQEIIKLLTLTKAAVEAAHPETDAATTSTGTELTSQKPTDSGDQVGGNKITTGNITGSTVVIGDNAQVNATYDSGDDVEKEQGV